MCCFRPSHPIILSDMGTERAKKNVRVPLPIGGAVMPADPKMADRNSSLAKMCQLPTSQMFCSSCPPPFLGFERLDWTMNKRRCPFYMVEEDGTCHYQKREIPMVIDLANPTVEDWLNQMIIDFAMLRRDCLIEMQMRNEIGVGELGAAQRRHLKLLEMQHEVYAHADKMRLLRRHGDEDKEDDLAVPLGVRRLFRSLLKDPIAMEGFLDAFSLGDARVRQVMEKMFESLDVVEPPTIPFESSIQAGAPEKQAEIIDGGEGNGTGEGAE